MALFGKLKDLFIEVDGDDNAQPAQGAKTSPQPPQTAATQTRAVTRSSAGVDDSVFNKFIGVLQKAIEAANLPGFDFYEFHMLYKKFLAEGKSDSEAMKNALISSETMRVDKNTLIANYGHYMKVLQEQMKVFDDDLNAFYRENIAEPKKKSQQINDEIAKKTNLIKQYEIDIKNLEADLGKIGVDVESSERQIEQIKAAFEKAYEELVKEFSAVNEKLKSL